MTHDMNALIQQVHEATRTMEIATSHIHELNARLHDLEVENQRLRDRLADNCLLYTSPSPRDLSTSRMPSSA